MMLNKKTRVIIINYTFFFFLLAFGILIYPASALLFVVEIFPDTLCDDNVMERMFYDNKKVFQKLESIAQSKMNSNPKHELNYDFEQTLERDASQLQARLNRYGGIKLFPRKKIIIDVRSFSVYQKFFMISITPCGWLGIASWNRGYVWISDPIHYVPNEEGYLFISKLIQDYPDEYGSIKYDLAVASINKIKRISGNWFIYN